MIFLLLLSLHEYDSEPFQRMSVFNHFVGLAIKELTLQELYLSVYF